MNYIEIYNYIQNINMNKCKKQTPHNSLCLCCCNNQQIRIIYISQSQKMYLTMFQGQLLFPIWSTRWCHCSLIVGVIIADVAVDIIVIIIIVDVYIII